MSINQILKKYGLNPENSIVVGSGIMQKLNIRDAKDIDLIVSKQVYDELKSSGKFVSKISHGKEVLVRGQLEVGLTWETIEKVRDISILERDSVIIDGVKYVSLEFLLAVKKDWRRPKDIDDIKLIEAYIEQKAA